MDNITTQLFRSLVRIRSSLEHDCYEPRVSYEGGISMITKEVTEIKKVNNPRLGIQWCPDKDCLPFHTHLNCKRYWTPPCHGDVITCAIRYAMDPTKTCEFILAREGIYTICATELGKTLLEDARRIVMNPEWNISQQRVKKWTEEKDIQKATRAVIKSWNYTLPILSGGQQFEWYRNRGFINWGPGAISKTIHRSLDRIIEQVEKTKGQNYAEMWEEYSSILNNIGVTVEFHMDDIHST